MQQSKESLVTIGMPVYNGEVTVGDSIESLLSQTYKNFELIISDNCSTDGTRKICERYREQDSRIKYVRNKQNLGALANFNKLHQMGEGSLFMWAACDDRWEPDFIKDLVSLLDRDSEAVLAFSQIDIFDVSTGHRYPGKSLLPLAKHRNVFPRLIRFLLFPEVESKASMIYGLMRRWALLEAGGLYSRSAGDILFGLDNITLFRIGLHGGYALSDRVLFHKGFQHPTLARLGDIITSPREIKLCYLVFRTHINESDLNRHEKFLLREAARFNYARRVFRNLVGRTLAKLRLPFLEPLYQKAFPRLQNPLSLLKRSSRETRKPGLR